MDMDSGACTDMDGCADYPCHEFAGCRDAKAPPTSQALPPTAQWVPPEAHTDDRTCVCLTGYNGDGELCLSDGTADVGTTASPSADAAASGAGTDGDSKTILTVFVILVVMTVVIVTMFVYSMYCKRAGGASFGGPSQQQMYGGNSFNNPMYSTGGYAPSPMAAQAMQQRGGSFSGQPQYATAEQLGAGSGDETYGPTGPGDDGYLSVVGANGQNLDHPGTSF